MTTKQAIEKAIEGGYMLMNLKDNTAILLMALAEKEKTLLNPLFWRSLGTALGWGIKCQNCGGEIGESSGMGKVTFKYQCKGKCGSYFDSREAEVWAKEWHRFIDVLSEGKSADDFFKEL